MQLAANLTLREQGPCPWGFISGGTQQVGMEKATGSFCSNPRGQEDCVRALPATRGALLQQTAEKSASIVCCNFFFN